MAQRLAGRICKCCVEDYTRGRQEALGLGFVTENDINLKRGRGCEMSHDTGYLGRLAVVEIMGMSDNLKNLTVKEGVTSMELKSVARREGMSTLRENALDLMLAGLTTIEEVLRVTAPD